MHVRNRFKALLERAVVGSGVARFARARMRGRALILAYHNIIPHGERPGGGDPSLHLPEDAFAAQLDLLQATHEVMPLDMLLAAGSPTTRRPLAAITFDDAYRGAVTAGVAAVARRGLPATVFVAPAFVGGRVFWWDALAPDGGFAAALRDAALTTARGEDAAVRRLAAEHGLTVRDVPGHATVASEAELRNAARHPGITVGSHSWSHPNLSRLGGADLDAELRRPLAWLRARFPHVSDALAYPYGLTSPEVARAAAAAGYGAALLVSGGWLRGGEERFHLPRLNVPAGLSRSGFSIRAAGLFCR